MRKADLTTRAIAGFIDLLLVLGLSRLPDVIGFLSATGYVLVRDGLFDGRSVGKRLVGLRVVVSGAPESGASFRESILRNATLTAAYVLFRLPYAGWILGPLALAAECLAAIGDDQGMRIGDLLADTVTVQDAPAAEAPADSAPPPADREEEKSDAAGGA